MNVTTRLIVFGVLLVLAGAVWLLTRLIDRARPGQVSASEVDLDTDPADLEAVMRALTVVQHNYAALVRENDELKTQFRDLRAERDHWRGQALHDRSGGR